MFSTVESLEIADDELMVYYRDTVAHSVSRVTLTGVAAAPVFVNEASNALQITVDDAYIFTAYTNGGEQAILRAPK